MTSAYFHLPEAFDQTCRVETNQETAAAISAGILNISIQKQGDKTTIRGLDAVIEAKKGSIKILIGEDNAKIRIGRVSGFYNIRLWRSSVIAIGDHTTCNGARFECDDSEIVIGKDCMLSDEIIVQSADQHGLVDLGSKRIVNNHRKSIIIGDHVWIGRRANILYGAQIGSGSIVGFGSLVNKAYPRHSLVVGIPAKVIRENTTWTRSPDSLDHYSKNVIEKCSERDA